MHPVSMIIFLCIGNAVGWATALLYRRSLPGLLGHVTVATIGAFITGYLILTFLPEWGRAGQFFAAIAGSVVTMYLVRFRRWRFLGHERIWRWREMSEAVQDAAQRRYRPRL